MSTDKAMVTDAIARTERRQRDKSERPEVYSDEDNCPPICGTASAAEDAALAQAEQPVVVKPLEWREGWGGSEDDLVEWVADTPWSRIFASVAGYRDLNGKAYERHADVPDELRLRLQAEAQAHYERRILSALAHPPAKREAGETAPPESHVRVTDLHVEAAKLALVKHSVLMPTDAAIRDMLAAAASLNVSRTTTEGSDNG